MVWCTGAFPDFNGDDSKTFGPVAAAPFGSSLILPISYAYIAMMGSDGLTEVPFPSLPSLVAGFVCISKI